nr:unnamed protein product [Spirometra erinaceieuropaei]
MSLHDEISSFVDDLIDSCILDGILNLHRAIKLGYFHLLAPDGEDANAQSGNSTADSLNKLPSCCRCVKCNCKVAATRYASHLSNCMGLGRNSSRRANKRIAEQQRLEDSDDVDEPYYLDSSPASTSGVRNDKTYTDLMRLVDLLPSKTDLEKKIELAKFFSRTRNLFIRLEALVKWANSASKVDKCEKISNFLDEQSFFLLSTANSLLPPFAVLHAIDIFVNKTYTRLPKCIKSQIVPPEPISDREVKMALLDLNRIIKYRLSMTPLPRQFVDISIKNGCVTFIVPHEFKVKCVSFIFLQVTLTLLSEALDFPWRILSISLLVCDPELSETESTQTSMAAGALPVSNLASLLNTLEEDIISTFLTFQNPLYRSFDSRFLLSLQLSLHDISHSGAHYDDQGHILSVDILSIPKSAMPTWVWPGYEALKRHVQRVLLVPSGDSPHCIRVWHMNVAFTGLPTAPFGCAGGTGMGEGTHLYQTADWPTQRLSDLSDVVIAIKKEWISLCSMFTICAPVLNIQGPVCPGVTLRQFDAKRLTLSYGPGSHFMVGY